MKRIGKGVEEFLRAAGLHWVEDYMKVQEACRAVLKVYKGLDFADYRKGILYLKYENLHALTDLYYRRRGILDAINAVLGRNLVKDIKFVSDGSYR